MAYGEKKVAINIRDGEEYGALIETRKDGEEQSYYPRQFPTDWNCEKLQVRQAFAYREESDQDPPKMITYVTGIARLDSDYDISVIGEPEKMTATIKVSFRPNDSPDLLKEGETKKEESRFRPFLSCPYGRYGRAFMGFNRADLELQSNDQWWLECRLHSTALQPLISAISAGTLKQASLSVRLSNLYTDEPPYAQFPGKAHLYLRPDKRDNTIDMPEVAYGWLEELGLGLGIIEISLPSEPEPDYEEPDYEQDMREADVTDSVSQPAIQASQFVAIHVDALRRTVKWVGGLIAAVLFLLLFK